MNVDNKILERSVDVIAKEFLPEIYAMASFIEGIEGVDQRIAARICVTFMSHLLINDRIIIKTRT